MLICCVCGESYAPEWRSLMTEATAICPECYTANFAGAQPPLDPWGSARAALEAAVAPASPRSARQREALTRLHRRWAAEAPRRLAEED